jgi:tetratricopeptide (TPR) repeat protein
MENIGMRGRIGFLAAGVILIGGFVFAPRLSRGQDPATTNGAKPGGDPGQSSQPAAPAEPAGAAPVPAPPSGKKSGGKDKNQDTATSNAPDQPVWDPLRADKDIRVGHYYMNKGDTDAAIDRFEDAIVAKPGFAIPYLYLGEAQEKKGQKRLAIKSYTKYLDLDPHADDAEKVRKKIDKLYKEVEKDKK